MSHSLLRALAVALLAALSIGAQCSVPDPIPPPEPIVEPVPEGSGGQGTDNSVLRMAQTDDGIVALSNGDGTVVAYLLAVTNGTPPYGSAPPPHSVEVLVTALDAQRQPLAEPFLDLGGLHLRHIANLEQTQEFCTADGRDGSISDCAQSLAQLLTQREQATLDADFAVFRADAVYQMDQAVSGGFQCLSWLNGAALQTGHGTYTVRQSSADSAAWFMGRRSADTSYGGWTLHGLEELLLGKDTSPGFPFNGVAIEFRRLDNEPGCTNNARDCRQTASDALDGLELSESRHARVTFARLNEEQLATAAWPAWTPGNYQTAPQTISENAACPGAPEYRCSINAFLESRPGDPNFGSTCYIHNAE